MVTTYNRTRASLSEPDYEDTIRRYGAWFLAPSDSPASSKFLPKGRHEIARTLPKEIRNIGPAALRRWKAQPKVYPGSAENRRFALKEPMQRLPGSEVQSRFSRS
jgi:hypothetical protein